MTADDLRFDSAVAAASKVLTEAWVQGPAVDLEDHPLSEPIPFFSF